MEKISKNFEDLNIINQLNSYSTLYPTNAECTSSSSAHGTFTVISCASLIYKFSEFEKIKFEKPEFIRIMFLKSTRH